MANLADLIADAAGKGSDRNLQGAFTGLAEAIPKAKRFVFSELASEACDELARSKPSSLLDATKFCRIPFDRVWLEWTPSSKIRDGRAAEWPEHHLTETPVRMGCHIECLDDTNKRFGVTLAWAFSDLTMKSHETELQRAGISSREFRKQMGPAVEISPLGFVVNWHDKWPVVDKANFIMGRGSLAEQNIRLTGSYRKFQNDEREKTALLELTENRVPTVVPFCLKMMKTLQEKRAYETIEKWQKASMRDWEGEYQMIIAMLCLMNSRNCVSLDKPDLKKINKARRIRGKEPIISYSTVTLNLSKKDAREVNAKAISEAEIRKHIVRGHFKIRKAGVFWWRPFIRGNAMFGEVKRRGYSVVKTPSMSQDIVLRGAKKHVDGAAKQSSATVASSGK